MTIVYVIPSLIIVLKVSGDRNLLGLKMNLIGTVLFILAVSHLEQTIEGISVGNFTRSVFRRVFPFLSKCTSGAGQSRVLFYSPYTNVKEVSLEIPGSPVPLNASLQTVFIIHGFLSYGTKDWVNDTVSALLQDKPRNVFVVDWRVGACSETIRYLNFQSYSSAANNTKAVGEYVASWIEMLVKSYSVFPMNVWVIGHSLGAHVAGFAGKALRARGSPSFGRITGLDPAGPLFRGLNASSRLDETDAAFVEVTHTSSLFGLQEAVGHVDLYYNGGAFQKSCLLKKPGCSHDRAVDYYLEAIRNSRCQFIGRTWSRNDGFGNITETSDSFRTIAGPLASGSSARGTFYIETNSQDPYCTGELPTSGEIAELPSDEDPMDTNIFETAF